ncbi:hypothetical protein DPQ33_04935 [Oceanidesulfovibrio indonesiensis]|uniref:HAMP domain-containing protein n=1 Tax=Oceanidesulfovibrio indonesiensis TaxID=54767 RepID=A0A7M3MIB3_9BACT|nr:SpoIIE family protein phosphatase [Oceanidesulfovibrio indonesiensis]TVM18814.1 hypothetical protein DPQ33_04935 [Oceanidesulfovibrio indonesiensis]
MSYRAKLFALLLLAALVPGLVAIGMDFTTTRQLNQTILEQSQENTLESAERGLRLVLDGLLKNIELSAILLEAEITAHAQSLRLALATGADLDLQAQRILARHRDEPHLLWEGIYLPEDEVMLMRLHPEGQNGTDAEPVRRVAIASDAQWLAEAQHCDEPCWQGPVPDPATGEHVTILAMAASPPGEPHSSDATVVAMAYDFSPLYGMFRNGVLPRGTEAFLVDLDHTQAAEGLPVRASASPRGDAPPVLRSSDAAAFGRMVEDLHGNKRGVVRMGHRGSPSFWAYGTFPDRPLAFVLVSPMSPYLESVMHTQRAIDSIFQEQIRFMQYVLAAMAMLLVLLSSLFSRMVTRPLADLARAMTRIAEGDYTARVKEPAGKGRWRGDEINAMRRTFNTMAESIQELEKTKEDLGVARVIQRRLLPETPPTLQGWDIAGECLYSKETGGDIYDFILTPPRSDGRERITLSVGDATGHGIQAALLMTTARAMLRALLAQGKPLAEVISDLNWLLTRDTYGTGRFLSLFAVEIAARSPVLQWVRCGHEPALLYVSDRDAVTHLRGPGAILGVDSSIRFQLEQTTLRPGSVLLLATDGVWETANPDGEMYGHTRLEAMIRRHAGSSAEQIVAAIMEDLRVFREKDSPEDDSTILVAKYQA